MSTEYLALVWSLRFHGPFEPLRLPEWLGKVRFIILSTVERGPMAHILYSAYSMLGVCVLGGEGGGLTFVVFSEELV